MQVQKVWRTPIIHSLVPNCQILEFQNAKFGQDADDDDWEVWFRNKHCASMWQQLMYHTPVRKPPWGCSDWVEQRVVRLLETDVVVRSLY